MNHLITTLPFILYSVLIVVLLAMSDPRRRQHFSKTSNKEGQFLTLSPVNRKRLAWSLVLPFIPLFYMGNFAGVLMYAGALTVIGWLVTETPASVI